MTRPCPCSHHLATRLLNQAPTWMPARLPLPAAGSTPATSSSVMLPCTRGDAFPLGLGVLARGGVTAWQHALAGLAPTAQDTPAPPSLPPGTRPGRAAGLPVPLAAELVSALAAVALAAAGAPP
jgi:hypothetical protein